MTLQIPDRHQSSANFCRLLLLLLSISVSKIQADETQVYDPPSMAFIQLQLTDYIKQQNPDQLELWQQKLASAQAVPADAINLVQSALLMADEKTWEAIVNITTAPVWQIRGLLDELSLELKHPFVFSNLHLWLGRELSQRQLYEEALEHFEQADPALVVDPAGYFFHRAVCEHHFMKRESATASLDALLNRCRNVPGRYTAIGKLMQADLASLEEKSLNEIARKMRDVERRLELGRSGQKVQKLEKEIIESLDELIAKLEQQQGGGGGGGAGQGNQSSGPAQESRVKGSTAPGEIDEKDLGRKDGWGNLPDKEKEQAKQILGTMFPPHYQRAIEAYNKKAAQRERNTP